MGTASTRRRASLRTPIVLALLVAALVPLVVAATIGVSTQRAALNARVEDDLVQYADSQVARAALIAERGEALGQLVVSRTLLRELVAEAVGEPPGDRDRIVTILDDARDASTGLTSIVLLRTDGTPLARTSGGGAPSLPARVVEQAQQVAATGEAVTDLQPGTDAPVWSRLAPMVQDDVVVAVALLGLDPSPLAGLVAPPADEADTSPRIVTNLYVAGPDGRAVVVDGEGACGPDAAVGGTCQEAAEAALAGDPSVLHDLEDGAGEPLVAATRSVPEHGLGLVVSLPSRQLLAPVTRASWTLAGLFLVVGVLAAAVAVLLGRRLTRPIRDLQEAAARIADGDLRAELPARAPGELEGLRRSFHSLTTAVATERAIQEGRYRDLEMLTHAMAHDLKGPLTVIRGMLELLVRQQVGDDARRRLLLERSLASALRMQRLIDDLLSLMQAIGGPLDREDVALEDVVAAAVDELDLAAVSEVEPLPTVRGERTLLDQIVLNLLDNAARYHAPGQQPRIRVSTGTRRDGLVALLIDDAGIGIPAERRQEMLETFARGDHDDGSDGTGLGLPIAKRVAERHGGSIVLEDSPLGGVRVVVWLPEAASPDADEGAPSVL
ncbi:MAG: ATP-binding protein [Nitriliruptoraceae bacterium]